MDIREIFKGRPTDSKWQALGDLLQGMSIATGPGLRVRKVGNQTILTTRKSFAGAGKDAAVCPFGEIISWQEGEETKRGIRGGVLYAGDKNYNVPNKDINTETAGDWLAYITLEVEANRDDENEIILPGIKTSPATDPAEFWETITYVDEDTQYPNNTNPQPADGLGTIIVPLGRLKVEGGSITLQKTGCGNIRVDQCGGVLNHTRE